MEEEKLSSKIKKGDILRFNTEMHFWYDEVLAVDKVNGLVLVDQYASNVSQNYFSSRRWYTFEEINNDTKYIGKIPTKEDFQPKGKPKKFQRLFGNFYREVN